MVREWSRAALVVAFVVACTTARAPEQAAQPAQVARASTPEPTVAATPDLPRRALELELQGARLEALRLTAVELRQRLRAGEWSDPLLATESVIAVLGWERLVTNTNAWEESVTALEACKPFASSTPVELAAALDQLLAIGLRQLGRVDEARALISSRGALADWLVIGPFANERGGGFDTAYPPEQALDLEQSVRGKERDVSWRANPCPEHPLGGVRLDALLRPNEQAIAYLATALHVDTPRDVVLHLGSTGAVKVFHGDQEVLARKVERPFHPDQDRVVLALHAGWNRLLIKLGIEERGAWIFSARVTELDGRPAVDLQSASAQLAAAGATTSKSSAQPYASARELLEARADDARAARWLTLYHLQVHPDDTSAHTAKTWAEKSRALEPDDVQGLYLLARANAPEPGASREEVQVNERLLLLKDVLARQPDHVAALLDLAEFALRDNPTPERADELTARALAAAPRSWWTQSLRARTLDTLGRESEAQVLMQRARVGEEGLLQDEALMPRALWLTTRGDADASLALLVHGFEHGLGSDALVASLIGALIDRGRVDEALERTRQQLERAPFDVERLLATAQLVEYAGRNEDARQLVQHALRICPEDTRGHLALARLAQRDGDLAAADRELAEVLRLDPGYDKARRQRQILAATAQDRFEEPFRWDALERIALAPSAAGNNDPVVVLDRTTVWRVNSDGTEHSYEHLLLRAQNLGGVKSLDNYAIHYPSDASLQVYNVRVIHPDRTFERAPAPRRGDFDWGGDRVRPFDLPPLAVGDAVELEYRVDQTRPDVFGQYFGLRHEFYADFPDPLAPVVRSELVVIAPADVPLYTSERNAGGLEKEETTDARGDVVRRWVARDLERPALQSAMPPRSEFAPAVDVSTFASWQAFGAWWWSFIEKEFVTTPAMKAKVRELTEGLASEPEKVRAIARFVGQEIRYNSWPFGTHGYEPFSAATIFERRFGDCKDKSILLRQMLAEIGVEAHPVLIKAQSWRPLEFLDVALVGAFNHCIAYLPATSEREGYYLDATADRNPIDYLRSDDQGATVVHVRDGQGSIHTIPYAPPQSNALVREYEVELDPDGNGVVQLVDTSTGEFGVGLRYAFGGEKGDLGKRLSEALADAFGKVDVVEAQTSVLEDIGAPARIETTLRSQGLWSRDAAGLNLRLSFDPIALLGIADEAPAERSFDLVLDRPFAMRTRVLYRLPPGVKVAKLPPDAAVVAPGLLEYHLTARETAEGVEVERDFTLLERRIELARYADFRGALRDVELAESRTIVLAAPEGDARKEEQR